MVEHSAIEFFEAVKGKKIKWSSWDDSNYVVPVGLKNNHLIVDGEADLMYPVMEGFDENKYGVKWVILD